ncbi:MAG: F0F1 ATP synthase subunit B [Gemmiger sp.]|uniref:F0F1 ATP synthase subunit B n=1 Tax=Gemmiger sp. TaxID=2049027 RepID=UPI002E78B538|nr:F0F1 ATP synthase subunit B [Gemmiger sp.]MEE0800809.1 F0F1 ATP synthase subunit B [Gemmiger sp.]
MSVVYQSLVAVEPITLICTICNLFIQMFIIKKFFLNKIKAVLDERRKAADQEITAAQAAREEAQAMKAEYEKDMANAKAKANEIVVNAQKTAAARSEELVGEAQAQAAQIRRQAEADIEQEKKTAINSLKNEIGGIAMEIASKVVEREISEKDHQDLIDEFIRNVGEAS